MDYAAALISENMALTRVLASADPAVGVPSCPGWTLLHLLRHVGRGDRWAAQIVDERRSEYLDPRDVRGGRPPEEPDEAAGWLLGGARDLVDAVDRVGADTAVWTFLGPRSSAWWIRRRLHEATVHRADAELALGRNYTLSNALAADGLSEWLERVVVQTYPELPIDEGQSMHLHATDGGEWNLRSDGGVLTLDQGHAEATVTLSGEACALFLAVVRRIPAIDRRIEVTGDDEVWYRWLERTPF